MGLIGQSCPR